MRQTALFLAALLLPASAGAQDWRGPAALAVQVEDVKGKNLAGAEILLVYLSPDGGGSLPSVLTGGDGQANVGGLAAGRWSAEIRHAGHMSYRAELLLSADGKPVVQSASHLMAPGATSTMKVKFSRGRGGAPAPVPAVPTEKAAATEKAPVKELPPVASGEPSPAPVPVPTPATAPAKELPPVPTVAPAPTAVPPPPAAKTPEKEVPPVAPPRPAAPAPAPVPVVQTPAVLAQPLPATPAALPATTPPIPPAPPAVAPAPAPPAPVAAPVAVAPSAPAGGPARARLCVECPAGESAAWGEAAISGGAAAGCPADLAARLKTVELDEVAQLSAELAAAGAGCRVIAVELPAGARFTGYRYEAQSAAVTADCLPGRACPAGDCRFPNDPVLRQVGNKTALLVAFESTAADPRRAVVAGYSTYNKR